MRVYCPTASSPLYPVIIVNAGLTYRIFPRVSVMTMPSAACSTAATRPARSIMPHSLDIDESYTSVILIERMEDFLRARSLTRHSRNKKGVHRRGAEEWLRSKESGHRGGSFSWDYFFVLAPSAGELRCDVNVGTDGAGHDSQAGPHRYPHSH